MAKEDERREIVNSLSEAKSIRKEVSDRLSAIYKEIDNLQKEVRNTHKRLHRKVQKRVPLCSWNFDGSKRHILRIIARLR